MEQVLLTRAASCAEELPLNFCRPPLFQSPHAPAAMAKVGELQRLFRTFLSLRRSCQQAEVTFYCDRDGICHVTLRVTPRHGFQSPCRGGAHSRSQEKQGSGAQNPPPASEGVSDSQKTPSAPAPAPARRSRRRGPAAILCDEQRRLVLPAPALPLAPRKKDGAPALPGPRPIILLVSRKKASAPHCCFEGWWL